jgi:GT2 family glycosyltransferase
MGCIDSLCEVQPDLDQDPSRIVIVSDGLPRETRRILNGVTWVKGRRKFIFPRAVNMGADAAIDDDILICGDDVRFTARGQIDRLHRLSSGCAAISPEVTGVCGQPAQRAGSTQSEADWLAFICTLIPRDIWTKVGPLDERFIGYGYDDVDWCQRAAPFGRIAVDHGSRVVHINESSYRSDPSWVQAYQQNREIFENKWRNAEVA